MDKKELKKIKELEMFVKYFPKFDYEQELESIKHILYDESADIEFDKDILKEDLEIDNIFHI